MPVVDFSMDGKIAIITGGSKGIGRAIALAFAEHGADVVISARGREALEQTKKEIEATGRQCLAVQADMAKDEDIKRLVDETLNAFGGVDVVVPNAASSSGSGPIIRIDGDSGISIFGREYGWHHVMRVNLWAPFLLSKLCHPIMKERGGGSVIHITSNEGVRPSSGLGCYAISKAALIHLARVCGKEWGPDGIRVNCIAPGLVRTEMAARLIQRLEQSEGPPNPQRLWSGGRQHIGEPHEIAGMALLLASDAGFYATGATFTIDGAEMA